MAIRRTKPVGASESSQAGSASDRHERGRTLEAATHQAALVAAHCDSVGGNRLETESSMTFVLARLLVLLQQRLAPVETFNRRASMGAPLRALCEHEKAWSVTRGQTCWDSPEKQTERLRRQESDLPFCCSPSSAPHPWHRFSATTRVSARNDAHMRTRGRSPWPTTPRSSTT